MVRSYVNRTIDKSPLYKGTIGDIDIHLLAGGYTIHDVELNKVTGNVPVPFFSAKRVDLTLQWDALFSRKVVGKIALIEPELNFVDSPTEASDQTTSTGGPWLEMISDLFPFKINSCIIKNGSIHFRAFDADPPVDVYLSSMHAEIENLTNIHEATAPLVTTVKASALAMGQAKFELNMKLDPFSDKPTFELGLRLLGLDVTQTNALAQAYGHFSFDNGTFNLVTELNAKEGNVEGYIKPLFRNLRVFNLKTAVQKDNPLEFFWEAVVGVTAQLLKNQSRDQLGTLIPLTGSLDGPTTDIFATVGNVLKNAFIRAYLPRFEGTAPDIDNLQFGPAKIIDPGADAN